MQKEYTEELKIALIICYLYFDLFPEGLFYVYGSLFFFIFTKMGSYGIYCTISFFPLCSVVNLHALLENSSMHLSGIGFETFMLLTLVQGVIFEIIPTSTSDIISSLFSTPFLFYSFLNCIAIAVSLFGGSVISFPNGFPS